MTPKWNPKPTKREVPDALPWITPYPVVLLTVCDEQGRANVITLSYVGIVCASPPLVAFGVRPERYSHGLLTRATGFVLNIPAREQLAAADLCGQVSGREANKLELAGFTLTEGLPGSPPVIEQCPLALVCTKVEQRNLGTHDLFLGRIEKVYASEALFTQGNKLTTSRVRPVVYSAIDHKYYGLGEALGRYGFSRAQ